MDIYLNGQTDKWTERQMDRLGNGHTNTNRWANKETKEKER
jgi:hypothetical protein